MNGDVRFEKGLPEWPIVSFQALACPPSGGDDHRVGNTSCITGIICIMKCTTVAELRVRTSKYCHCVVYIHALAESNWRYNRCMRYWSLSVTPSHSNYSVASTQNLMHFSMHVSSRRFKSRFCSSLSANF